MKAFGKMPDALTKEEWAALPTLMAIEILEREERAKMLSF